MKSRKKLSRVFVIMEMKRKQVSFHLPHHMTDEADSSNKKFTEHSMN